MSIFTDRLPFVTIRYALLGLLRDCPATGYELTQRFEQGIGRHAWSVKHSQIYPELRKLADEGAIEVVAEGTRGKRVYGLTETGRSDLHAWLLRGPEEGTVRNPLLLWMFLIGGLTPEEATGALEAIAARTAETLDELTLTYKDAAADGADLPGVYAAQFGIFAYRAIGEWAEWAIGEQRKRME